MSHFSYLSNGDDDDDDDDVDDDNTTPYHIELCGLNDLIMQTLRFRAWHIANTHVLSLCLSNYPVRNRKPRQKCYLQGVTLRVFTSLMVTLGTLW